MVSNALLAIREGMPVSEASATFGFPRTTIRHKVSGQAPESTGLYGPQLILGMEVEVKIVDSLLGIAKMGFSINKGNLSDSIQTIVQPRECKLVFKKGGREGEGLSRF